MGAAVLVGGVAASPIVSAEVKTICNKAAGREFIARYWPDGAPSGCIAGCAVSLSEINGHTARWKITGAICPRRQPPAAGVDAGSNPGAPAQPEVGPPPWKTIREWKGF